MSLRHVGALLAGLALATLLAGCGLLPTGDGGQADESSAQATPSDSTGPTEPPKLPSAGTATSDDDITVTVHSFKADGEGFATLLFSLENGGDDPLTLSARLHDRSGRTHYTQLGGVTVRDDARKETQGTLGDTDRNCLCFLAGPGSDIFELQPGEQLTLASVFPISDEATTVTVKLPDFPDVPDVPVERP